MEVCMRQFAVIPVIAGLVATVPEPGGAQAVAAEAQIAAAALAAPADRRDGVTVLGYDGSGKLVTLRRGTNDLICLADDPAREGFESACYHESLEPFMARGRELTAQGVTGQERIQMRYTEAEAGTLKMPEQPAMLYILSGESFDASTGTVAGEYRRSSLYIPNATAASTGLSTQASDTDPWIMFPGTPGAHIMITPPRSRSGGG
jgi:hypothetical protein